MRILVVSNLFPPFIEGGYEIACNDTVEVLRDLGHECLILTSQPPAGDESVHQEVSTKNSVFRKLLLHHSWNTGIKTYNQHYANLKNLLIFHKISSRFKPDIVYFWNIASLGPLILQYAAARRSWKVLIHFMGPSVLQYVPNSTVGGIRKRLWQKFQEFLIRRANAIFCSEFELSKYKRFGFSKAFVLPPFVKDFNTIKIKKVYEIDESAKGVFVGQFVPHKGSDFLIEALDSLTEKGIRVRFDIYTTSKTARIRNINQTSIRVLRGERRIDILKSLHSYDFGVFPSVWDEPFGIAQIEMMAAGLPVISSLRGGSVEVFDGTNLVAVDLSLKNALASKIEDLIFDSSSHRKIIGGKARATILSRYTVDSFGPDLDTIIKEVSYKNSQNY